MLLPYSISFEGELATFLTDNNAKYTASFQLIPNVQDDQLSGFFYDFSFQRDKSECINRQHNDGRVKPTIQKLITFFFEQSPYSVMYFVCEAKDSKHEGRKVIFNDWHSERDNEFEIIHFRIPGPLIDAEPTKDIVGALVFMKDHPLESAIRAYAESEIYVYEGIKRDM
jgi:hypothetical protein